MSMTIIRELCGACPQDLVVELDDGRRFDFYVRHGFIRLYDEFGAEVLATKDIGGDIGILPLDEVERHVRELTAGLKVEWSSSAFDNYGGYYSVLDGDHEIARWAPGHQWSEYAKSMPEGYRYEWVSA